MATTTLPSTDSLTERYTVERWTPSGWLVLASYAAADAPQIAQYVDGAPGVRVFDQETQKVVTFTGAEPVHPIGSKWADPESGTVYTYRPDLDPEAPFENGGEHYTLAGVEEVSAG